MHPAVLERSKSQRGLVDDPDRGANGLDQATIAAVLDVTSISVDSLLTGTCSANSLETHGEVVT
jgi:hypothetical protein